MSLKSSTKVDVNTHELVFAVDAEAFSAAVEKAYQRQKKSITVPGFRKGKAPRKIIEAEYGEGVFYEDAVNGMYQKSVAEVIDELKLEVVDMPNIEVTEVSKENGVSFKATFTTKPEVEIKDYKGIKVNKTVKNVTDEDVANELKRYQEKDARIIDVTDRPLQKGDTAVFDFEGFVDGEAFEGGKAEHFSLEIGSGQFIPGFEEQIVGHNTGDEFEVNVTFPEDYQAEELKGKATTFKCKLHEIKMKELPEVDDEFVKDVSEFDTLADYKEDLKKKLAESKEKEAADDLENQLIDKLVELVQGEIPEAMYENKIADSIREFGYRLQSQGLNLDTYMKYTGMNVDQMKEGFRPQAERQVKLRLALEKIAALEELKAGEEDLNQEYQKIAEQYKMEADKIKELIPAAELEKDICVEKAINLVRDNANIKDAE